MALRKVNESSLTQVADAIRRKAGTSAKLEFPNEWESTIDGIAIGGQPAALGTKNIKANGTYNAANDGLDGFSTVNVNVPASGIDTSEGDAEETDIAAGKIAFADGKRVAGSVPVVESGETQAAVFDVMEQDSIDNGYRVAAHLSKDVLARKGAVVDTVVPKTSFGEATPDQVLVGTTFTSKEGINLPGAYNPTTVNLQTKRVKPETSFQQVTYDAADGYTGLARVEIEAIQTQTKEIWRNGTYTPDTGKFFDSVTVNILSDAKLGDATSYTFGQIGVTQTSATASYSCAESIHVEDGAIVLDNATSQTFTMKSGDTSGACFNGIRGLYFQKSGTTYYVPPDCSIVRSAVKGAGNATTGYAYKGSIYPVIVDAGTVMGTKNITENGTYYASDDGFDGFESVNVNVGLPPIEVSSRGTASDMVSGKKLYDDAGNVVEGSMEQLSGWLPDYNPSFEIDYEGDFGIRFTTQGKQYLDNGDHVLWHPADFLGEAKPENVLSNVTFTSKNGLKKPGTMTDNGTVTQVLDTNTTSYTIPAGKHSGSGTVSIDTETVTVTPSKIPLTVKANTGKVISSFTMNAIPDKYIEPSGTLNVTGNGTHNVTQYASVNVNVPASGVELPTLTKPAGTSEDLVEGKQLIAPDGSVIEGSVMDVASGYYFSTSKEVSVGFNEVLQRITATGIVRDAGLCRRNSYLEVQCEASKFGNATRDKVLQGATFTSENGVELDGSVPVRDSVTITLDGINRTSSVNSAGYYGSVSAVFDSSAIEALLDAL